MWLLLLLVLSNFFLQHLTYCQMPSGSLKGKSGLLCQLLIQFYQWGKQLILFTLWNRVLRGAACCTLRFWGMGRTMSTWLWRLIWHQRWRRAHSVMIESSGLVVSPSGPWFGASPDAHLPDADLIIEIKCEFLCKDRLFEDMAAEKENL